MRRYLESAIVVLVLSALSLTLYTALNSARDDMEEAAMQSAVQSIRSQLMAVVAHRETFGGQLPASDNPLDWVRDKPANYIGAVDAVPEQKSVWFYDRRQGLLVYLFRNGQQARYQLSRHAQGAGVAGVMAGIGLLSVPAAPGA